MYGVRGLLFLFAFQANASEKLGTLMHRELHRRAYNNALVERYKHLPEVKRIVRHRHLPAPVYKVRGMAVVVGVGEHTCVVQAAKLRRTIINSEAAKTKRRIANSAPGTVVVKPERRRKIVSEVE